jgi:hypothetical protein
MMAMNSFSVVVVLFSLGFRLTHSKNSVSNQKLPHLINLEKGEFKIFSNDKKAYYYLEVSSSISVLN